MPESLTSATVSGHISAEYDEACDVVRVVGVGRWTVAAFERHFRELGAICDRLRERCGHVRLIADMRQAADQSSRVALRMSECCDAFYMPEDRIAIVVGSAIIKGQTEALHRRATTAVFLSMELATRWVLAPDIVRRQPELSIEWGVAS